MALLAASAIVASGCGAGNDEPRLTVSAASSLTEALGSCSRSFSGATVRLEFGGSDELAARIRQGAKPDVYAAANTELPEQLAKEGLLERPKVFATNALVLATRSGSSKVQSLEDLTRPGLAIATGSPSVPGGAYVLDVLSHLAATERMAITENIRSKEPDVKGVVGKLAQGAVDAGFVYRSDVKATHGKLAGIALPAAVAPAVSYSAAVVRGTSHAAISRSYVEGLRAGACAKALRAAGFGRREAP